MENGNQDYVNRAKASTLLFVDDEENILNSLRRLFRPQGFKIFTATGGADGLKIMESEKVDLIISDMRMPEMNGAEFLEKVAARWPDTVRILLTGYADISLTIEAINKGSIYKYISKPWDDNDIKLSVQYALERKFLLEDRKTLLDLTQDQNKKLNELNGNLELLVKKRTQEVSDTLGRLEKSHLALKKSYTTSIKMFSNLVELRKSSLAGHSRRVAEHVRNIASDMKLPEDEVQNIFLAALLHDIGKIVLNDTLIDKPYNSMNTEERAMTNRHAVIGQGILMAIEPLKAAGTIIRSHHERHDGKGYPDGLKGDDIPLGARILAVVNDYDALQIGTLSTQRLSQKDAVDYISVNKGSRYDPEVVIAFLKYISDGERQARGESFVFMGSEDLKSGMVIGRDLVSRSGVLLLSTGHVLDGEMIRNIRNFEKSADEKMEICVSTSGNYFPGAV